MLNEQFGEQLKQKTTQTEGNCFRFGGFKKKEQAHNIAVVDLNGGDGEGKGIEMRCISSSHSKT